MTRRSKTEKPREEVREILEKLGFIKSTRAADLYHITSTGPENQKYKVDIKATNAKVSTKYNERWVKVFSEPMSKLNMKRFEETMEARSKR